MALPKILKESGTEELIRLIREAIDKKQDKLTIDTTVNDTSENPVENKAIYDAIKDLVSASYDSTTKELTLTAVDGTETKVEIKGTDEAFVDASFDADTCILTFTQDDGNTKDVDLSALVDIYEGVAPITVTPDSDGTNLISHDKSGVDADEYTLPKMSVDEFGHVTEAEDIVIKDTDTIDIDVDSDEDDPTKTALKAEVKEDSIGFKHLDQEVEDAITPVDIDEDGDIPVLSIHRTFNNYHNLYAGLSAENDNLVERVGIYFPCGDMPFIRGKMFNRIKFTVATPGWVRIGIFRGTPKTMTVADDEYAFDGTARGIFKAGANYNTADTYSKSLSDLENDETCDGKSHTALKKWLVYKWFSTTGLKIVDIPDTVINSKAEYIAIDAKTGRFGFSFNNTGAAVTAGAWTIPNGFAHNPVNMPTAHISKTNMNNHCLCTSNDALACNARIGHNDNFSSKTSRRKDFNGCNHTVATPVDQTLNIKDSSNDLGIGLYRRTAKSEISLHPIDESAISRWTQGSTMSTNGCLIGYGPNYEEQQTIVGRELFAIDCVVHTPGDITMYVFSSNDPATCKIVDCITLRPRAIGPQRIHLPHVIVLKSGQWVGFDGVTEALVKNLPTAATAITGTAFNQGYFDDGSFACVSKSYSGYKNLSFWGDEPDEIKPSENTVYQPTVSDKVVKTKGMSYWSGVKYIPGTNAGEGRIDFTNATYIVENITDDKFTYLSTGLVTRTPNTRISRVEDLKISITGDSITTYRGTVSKANDFTTTKNTVGDNAICYPDAGCGMVSGQDSTWWGAFVKDTRAQLLFNDAWSGCKITGTESATASAAGASTVRCNKLHNLITTATPKTTAGCLGAPYGRPDIILIMMGTNDLAGNVAAGSWSNTNASDMTTILGAYETMLYKIKTANPESKIVSFMMPRGTSYLPYTNGNGYSISQLAAEMEYVAKAMNCYFVPLSYFSDIEQAHWNNNAFGNTYWIPSGATRCDVTVATINDRTLCDWLHPNANGHRVFAEGLRRFIEENVVIAK